MDFLKELALPQSLEHYKLVILLATISAVVFVPYISYVLGSSVLSLWYNRKGRERHNATQLRFARILADLALYNKSLVTFLGIIPALSLVFSYAQILQASPSIAVGLAGFGFLFVLAGLILLYAYKYTFRVQGLLESYQGMIKKHKSVDAVVEDVNEYQRSNTNAHMRTGRYGLSFLTAGVVLYSAAYCAGSGPTHWSDIDSLLSLFLSADVWIKMLTVAALTFGTTGIGVQYFILIWKGKQFDSDDDLVALVMNVGRRWTIVSLLLTPAFLLAALALLSGSSASGSVYGLAGLSLLFFFVAAHFVYGYHKSGEVVSLAYALFAFLLGVALTTVNDYVAVGNSTKAHAASLAFVHEKELDDLKMKLGVGLLVLSGEDIYNAKCSACHLYDQKKVGPPYFETIPKYAARKSDLVSFVLNPQKINPAYPPMPNQGLKASEADSIAVYLMRKVAEAGKMKLETPTSAK
jgi:cytochrome c